ncbi:MAG: YihA family ribosome biogenesis GTP-binding protein [Acidobacteria bacterium]|nr:YihA family ribosome biogenesis GTP-binding protein [Acidobacteriota bacterium]
MRVLSRFIVAASDARHFPGEDLPEMAFLGRSNVGKSSVINSLLGHKIARTSSSPGRTRTINFFEVRWPGRPKPQIIFTDLPGYGYAKVLREISQHWATFIEPYLTKRASLALCLVLIDSNIPPQNSDQQLMDFLRAVGRRLVVVATKSDRLSGNQLASSLQNLSRSFREPRLLAYSAKTGMGREQLWQEIRAAAAAFSEQRALPS